MRCEEFGELPAALENPRHVLFAPLLVPITASGLQG